MTADVSSATSTANTINTNVRVFRQNIQNVYNDSPTNAPAIGTLQQDTNRLDIVSALTKGVMVDYLAFGVKGDLNDIALGSTSQGGDVRIQILDKTGQHVFADSSPNASPSLVAAYQQLTEGSFSLKAGDYILKVTRADGELNTTTPNYAIQLTAGNYKNDYDTVESPATNIANTTPPVPPIVSALTATPPDGSDTTNIFTETGMAGAYSVLDVLA